MYTCRSVIIRYLGGAIVAMDTKKSPMEVLMVHLRTSICQLLQHDNFK